MQHTSPVGMSGLMIADIRIPKDCLHQFHRIKVVGCDIREWEPSKGHIIATRKNTFVNTGLNMALDRLFGINGPPTAPTGIAVSPDDQAISGATTLLDPATGDTGFVRKAFDSTPTRSSQTVTTLATFTQADVTFAINKVGILNTTTDAGTGLLDVIGGTGNSPFTIDLTGVTSWSLVMSILVTASAT